MSLRLLGISLFLFAAFLAPVHAEQASLPEAKGKIIAVFTRGNTTELVIESPQRLISGRNMYVGDTYIPVAVGDLLSKKGGLHYYEATTPGKVKIKEQSAVYAEYPKRPSGAPPLIVKLEGTYNYEQKHKAEITAVQAGRVMIDRGTLHQVRELDLYRVYGPDGTYKGMLEINGIGDLQSNGLLYNALEDFRKDVVGMTAIGDRVVFAGQRKPFALGFAGGFRFNPQKISGKTEQALGGGLLWNNMFRDGWGTEVLFGFYARGLKVDFNSDALILKVKKKAFFIFPMWLKKNFFYPRAVSPFLAVGFAIFDGSNTSSRLILAPPFETVVTKAAKTTVVPMLGAGVELFPARFFRPRFEIRWFKGPKLIADGDVYNTESVFYSLGFFTAW